MKENNRLKKIIDLYVDKGANNDYLHEEMLKTFNSVSKEEKEEGYQYLNWKLQEAKGNGKNPKQINFMAIFIVVFIIASIIIIVLNQSSSNYDNGSTTYNGSIRHYCEASDCLNDGTYSITRSDGKKEYYCYKHYKQMEEWAEMIMGY